MSRELTKLGVLVVVAACLVHACGSDDAKKKPRVIRPDAGGAGAGGEVSALGGGETEGGVGAGAEASAGASGVNEPIVQAGAAGDGAAGARSIGGAGGEGGAAPGGDLVAYYPFSGDTVDASGYGNDCTPGTTTLAIDRHGVADSAYHFDGTSTSYMSCGSDSSLDLSGPLTLSAWFLPEAAVLSGNLSPALIAKWFPPDQRSYMLMIQSTDQSGIGLCARTLGIALAIDPVGTGAMPGGVVCDDVAVTAGVWQHAAAVFEPGQRLAVYLDGVLAQELTGAQVVGAVSDSGTALLLGRNNLGYFTGSIDEVRVHARALSGTEVAALAAL